MQYLYSSLLFIFLTGKIFCQCPIINNAMVNSCGATEGNNEFVIFTTTTTDFAGGYQVNYGSGNPPSVSSTGIMPGSNASVKSGSGSIMASGGCTIHEIISPGTTIPAGSRVIFIPAAFDQQYDVSAICNGTDIYVVYINTSQSPAKWASNGTLANSPTGSRYLQVQYNGQLCPDNVQN